MPVCEWIWLMSYLEKFHKENKMIDVFKIIDKGLKRAAKEIIMKEKVEMPDKSTVLAVARKCPDAKDVLKRLFPEAFEEKEIKLQDGKIYKENPLNQYYLLESCGDTKWTLRKLSCPNWTWCGQMSTEGMKDLIKTCFTLCPHATITVKENEPWNPLSPTSVRYDDC